MTVSPAAAADIKFRVALAESRCNSALSAVSHFHLVSYHRPVNNAERTAARAASAVYDKSVL